MTNAKEDRSLDFFVAPLWRRAFAYVIDLIFIMAVVFLPMKNLYGGAYSGDFESIYGFFSQAGDFSFGFFMYSLIVAVLTILYWALLEYYIGQSVGKIAMGIRVVNLEKIKLKFMQCFTRNISKASTFVLLLDVLYGVVKKDQRRYFEVISNTRVVNANASY
ncbi:MAG: RDD family protein [Nanoarchaeota archaeon]|nr:RDD family protein [Nanoarchaeota archaeon]